MTRPPAPPPKYNELFQGVYGEFGSGAGLKACYLQTAIGPRELEKLKLIRDIPGSRRWPVRALFQREIDDVRVGTKLLDYLRDSTRIKFFNPLTLTILPIDNDGSILNHQPKLEEVSFKDGDARWNGLESEGLYRFRWMPQNWQYGWLDWNGDRTRIVAIDGQHRLSALMRLKAELESQVATGTSDPRYQAFLDWSIPVVVLSFQSVGTGESPGVLEVVRNIFVYINTTAQRVGENRSVLLNDESVNALAAQEVLEVAHANDLRPLGERNELKAPLLFFDWRGAERDGEEIRSRAAIAEVKEVRDWFRYYILGPDFSDRQAKALGIAPGDSLKRVFTSERLTHRDAAEMRKRLGQDVLPALQLLLEGFRPLALYAQKLRELERRSVAAADSGRHAFDRLRFGYSKVDGVLDKDVEAASYGRIWCTGEFEVGGVPC